jgi:hydroxymethylpyrimidine/phosphomethylpyrimidine kinase
MTPPLPVALTIAGADPGGGAGIAADLMTFAAHRVYGTVVVAAITAQNTREFTRTAPVSPDLLAEQIAAVYSDIAPAAVKIGMLGSARNVTAAARALKKWKARNVVLDPVLVATSD